MRQWNVPPKMMCRQHLLGEHLELHMFASVLKSGLHVDGFLANGLLETHTLRRRHNQLRMEMKRRGWHHGSPLDAFPRSRLGKIDVEKNLKILARRCKECRILQRMNRGLHERKES